MSSSSISPNPLRPGRRRIWGLFGLPILLVYVGWTFYMARTDGWVLFRENWFMTVTMVVGSFVAGASSEGGGAIAFPAMTLVFNIPPSVARTFSLAIQSIGMTAASLWILAHRIRIETTYLGLAGAGGVVGITAGTYVVDPLIPPAYAKMLFVSFWLSFGIALFVINHVHERLTRPALPELSSYERGELVAVGLLGGVLSAVLGSGIDICTFAFVTMKYHLSEKVATPTSVVLMASNAIVGAVLHLLFVGDVTPVVHQYWLVSVPVVVLGAPLGAYVVSKLPRLVIAGFLYVIFVVQFVSALWILKPMGSLLLFSGATFLSGLVLFFLLTRQYVPPVVSAPASQSDGAE